MSNWGGLTLTIDPFTTRRIVLTGTNGFGHIEGQIYYDSTDKTITLNTDVEGVSLQIGQENYIRGRNDQGSQLNNSSAVYISGSTGDRPKFKLAKADAEPQSDMVGIATHNIGINNDGYITTFGLVRDIKTDTLEAGKPVYLSPSVPGGLTKTKPTAPDKIIRVGHCVRAHATQGIILVNIQCMG